MLAVFLVAIFAAEGHAARSLWQEVDLQADGSNIQAQTRIKGPAILARSQDLGLRLYTANEIVIRDLLADAPHETTGDRSHVIELPLGGGELGRFYVQESPMVEAGFAHDFPGFRTYRVRGIDDPTARGRLSLSELGFHAMLQTVHGRVFIDPQKLMRGDDRFVMRQRREYPDQPAHCAVDDVDQSRRPLASPARRSASRVPGNLLEYRLAVSATDEYRLRFGGTVGAAQAAIGVAINRVNEIYERDLGIRLTLVANNQILIENGDNVPFTNDSAFAMFGENQAWIDSQIGNGSYDVGHVFSTGAGGAAFLGSACDAGDKAKGATGQFNPVGDPFYIDFVAHELGHQFNADHSFNGTTNACGSFGARIGATAYEPGSGTTIMGYAGICGVEDLQPNSDATFHAGNIAQIDAFVAGAGNCGVQIPTSPPGNNEPTITPVPDYTIPVGTPFALEASASDSDLQTLSYQWDQLDPGGSATDAVTFGTDLGDNPLFRSYEPQDVARRDFPALGTQLQNLFDDAEVIPCNARALDFRLTVRDGASGQATEDVRVTTTTGAGPFRITNFGTPQTLNAASSPVVFWDVANTSAGAVNCPNVVIELLTFADPGRTQYSVHQLNGGATLNDGNETLVLAMSHPRARIRIRCENNVFYDISNADLNIVGSSAMLYDDTDNNTFFNNNGTTGFIAPACGSPVIDQGSSGGGGSSSADLLLAGLGGSLWWLAWRRRRYRQG